MLGRDVTQSTVLPLLLRLLKDDESEVRFHLISKVDVLCRVLGADVLSQSLAPAVLELSHDAKWRVRLSVVEKLAYLGKQLVWFFLFRNDQIDFSTLGVCPSQSMNPLSHRSVVFENTLSFSLSLSRPL